MDTFRGHYSAILIPYNIDPENSAATVILQESTRKMYSAVQEGVPIESTLFCLSVNYREMISCTVSTWIIVRSRSKYKLENL